jgi:hypothetical protein
MGYARKLNFWQGEKGARTVRRPRGMAVLSVLAAIAVALCGAAPAFAAESATGPETSKTLTENSEHTGGTITLSVKGSSSYSSTSTGANVILNWLSLFDTN